MGRRRLLPIALVIAAVAAPAAALAFTPRTGRYGQCRSTSGQTVSCKTFSIPAVQFDYRASTRRISRWYVYNSCAVYPMKKQGSFAVRRDKTFRYHAFLRDVLNQRWEETISGKFIASTTVRGTMTFKKLSAATGSRLCTRTTRFVARRFGGVTPG